jgi:hypothetical protein
MCGAMFAGKNAGSNRMYGSPLWSTRIFSKFQRMSLLSKTSWVRRSFDAKDSFGDGQDSYNERIMWLS